MRAALVGGSRSEQHTADVIQDFRLSRVVPTTRKLSLIDLVGFKTVSGATCYSNQKPFIFFLETTVQEFFYFHGK